MAFTLISVSTLDRAGYAVHIEDANCTIATPKPKRKTIAIFPMVRGLASDKITLFQLHTLMGHADQNALKHAVKAGTITGIDLDMSSEPQFCEVCVQAKAARKPIPKVALNPRPKKYGDKVVIDFLPKKSDAFAKYQMYEAWVKRQRGGAAVKLLGSDRGGEFTSSTTRPATTESRSVRCVHMSSRPVR